MGIRKSSAPIPGHCEPIPLYTKQTGLLDPSKYSIDWLKTSFPCCSLGSNGNNIFLSLCLRVLSNNRQEIIVKVNKIAVFLLFAKGPCVQKVSDRRHPCGSSAYTFCHFTDRQNVCSIWRYFNFFLHLIVCLPLNFNAKFEGEVLPLQTGPQ